MARTKASNESQYRYNQAHLKRIPLDVQKEHYERIKAHAESRGESVNGFIKRAIDEAIDRDTSPEAGGSPAQAFTRESNILSPETLQAAQEAADSTGEE